MADKGKTIVNTPFRQFADLVVGKLAERRVVSRIVPDDGQRLQSVGIIQIEADIDPVPDWPNGKTGVFISLSGRKRKVVMAAGMILSRKYDLDGAANDVASYIETKVAQINGLDAKKRRSDEIMPRLQAVLDRITNEVGSVAYINGAGCDEPSLKYSTNDMFTSFNGTDLPSDPDRAVLAARIILEAEEQIRAIRVVTLAVVQEMTKEK